MSIPVVYQTNDRVSKDAFQTEVSGMLIRFLEDFSKDDQLVVAGKKNAVVSVQKRGVTTRIIFYLSDEKATDRFELFFTNGLKQVECRKGKIRLATGDFLLKNGKYSIRLKGNAADFFSIKNIVNLLNDYFMTLYRHEIVKIPVTPLFLQDTLNVIAGVDNQFHTNFNHFWFDRPLYDRMASLGRKAFSRLATADNPDLEFNETIQLKNVVTHTAQQATGPDPQINGTLTTIFKADGENNYGFLLEGETYRVTLHYNVSGSHASQGKFTLDKLTIRNLKTLDFAELYLFDFVNSDVPLLYIDLIQSVVQKDGEIWTVDQILQVIQDSFRFPESTGSHSTP